MQLIKNRGICILTKGDKGKQLKIMTKDLNMHETYKHNLKGAFRLNQSLKEHTSGLDTSCASSRKPELLNYSASILPIYEGCRKSFDEHLGNIDPHKEVAKAVKTIRL